ncbi:MAG: VOC family protein [Alphaproteobacteria bacterium]
MSKHGHFHWNELMTWDAEKAKAFYADTLGWTFEAFPMPEGAGAYTVCKAGDDPVGGIMEMKPGTGFDGVPDHWFAYITVDDVDSRLAKVEAAGGQVMRPPFDVPNVGRIAIVKDAAGGAVGWITPAQEG